MSDFVGLHVHGQRSELDGLSRSSDMVAAVAADGQPAVAITDHGTLGEHWGLVRATKEHAAKGGTPVKPILGLEAYFAIGDRGEKNSVVVPAEDDFDGTGETSGQGEKTKRYEHLTLLARNAAGWRNLVTGHNTSWGSFWYKPRWDYDLLAQHSDGLIAGSGCLGGPVAGPLIRDDMAGARANLARLVEIMGRENVFVEVMDHGIAAERKVIPGLVALSKEFGLPMVATNDSHYTNACDADAHDAWLAIGSSKGTKAVLVTDEKRFRFNGSGYHLRTAAEMHTLFDGQPGTEAAVANTLLIAERIENDVIPAVGFRLPHFAVPPGHTSQTFLYEKVKAGAVARYGSPLPQQVRHELRLELDVIDGAGLTDYILIVDDVIAEARRRGIRVGPGRGSGAGSRVLYCLGVTQVEPIAHGLLFERFLDPARPGMPDVDIDFQADRRDELYRYAADKYGVDYVARIGAVGMAWARKAIRSVGRVTAQDELADTLARLVPGSSASLASALDPAVPEGAALRAAVEGNADAAALVAAAQAVEGVASASSVHACGVIFGDEPLTTLVPMRRIVKDPNHPPVTEWDSVDLEEFGLVKFDFLAIADLVVVDKAVEFIKETTGETVDPEQASLDPSDPKAAAAYRLLAEGRTAGVFQVASHGMTELSKAVKPNSLNDIAALVALYRPGPLKEGMHKAYASRKHGADVDYGIFTDDPVEQNLIASVLDDTFGVIAFQEQMQQLSGVVAGYSKTDSYKLLKLVAKKKRAQLDLEYPKFVAGGKSDRHSDGRAKVAFRQSTLDALWKTFEASGDYAFNRSHSAAYGLLAYQTAWLKANWPAEYGAALLSVVPTDKSKAVKRQQTISSLRADGVAVLAPDVNDGQMHTSVAGPGRVRLGLSEIKGVGSIAEVIVSEREANGPYRSLADVAARVKVIDPADGKTTRINAGQLAALAEAGAVDAFGTRMGHVMVAKAVTACPDVPVPNAEWGVVERSARQQERLGVVTGDLPVTALVGQLTRWRAPGSGDRTVGTAQVPTEAGVTVHVVGQVSGIETRAYSRGTLAKVTLADADGEVVAVFWDEVWRRASASGETPKSGEIVGITGVTVVPWRPGGDDDDAAADVVPEIRAGRVWRGPLTDAPTRPAFLPGGPAVPDAEPEPDVDGADDIEDVDFGGQSAALAPVVPLLVPMELVPVNALPPPPALPPIRLVPPLVEKPPAPSTGPEVVTLAVPVGLLCDLSGSLWPVLTRRFAGLEQEIDTWPDGKVEATFRSTDGTCLLVIRKTDGFDADEIERILTAIAA